MPRDVPDDRLSALGVELKPRLKGRDIVVASMSIKAVKVHGYEFHEWEHGARDTIKSWGMNRPIVIRDKPNKKTKPMPPIGDVLETAHMLVTHHSNAAVDAIVNGVPVYAKKGVGSLVSPAEMTKEAIEDPFFPSEKDRQAFLADVAYAQWTPDEMRSGKVWDFMRPLLCG
jgi:hypothetical protein